jgi:threonine aldolase
MRVVDLRSDTITKPTAEMRAAMATAEVGDDVLGDDPTVQRLEDKVARLFGVEASLFVPSGTMGNQVCLHTHAHPGDELICDDEAHIDWYEVGAPAALSGLQIRTIPASGGIPDPEHVRAAIRPKNIHHPKTGIVALENTHNRAGGVVLPLSVTREILRIAHEHDVKCHLDGARIWNAHAATGVSLADWVIGFDSVSVCLSKGMGAPVGSMILGTREFVDRARRTRKRFGGGMRQVGILAAAGIWAIEHQLPKMVDDHRRAKTLADAFRDVPGVRILPDPPPTNILVVEFDVEKHNPDAVQKTLEEKGVRLLGFGTGRIRAVTHRDVNNDDISYACDVIRQTLRN